MSEQLSTRRCDTPLLQAFVDNRTILVKIAARITGCRSRAEDVVQDAFFRLQSAPQITSSFKAQLSYLFQIVRNLAIDHYRKQALEQKYSGPEEEGLNVVIQGASPETSHINYATLEHIADALTELPKRTRYAFEMYRLHGVPQKDIAKELGVSPPLVNFMIRDALVHSAARSPPSARATTSPISAPAADGGEHSSAPVAAHRRRLRLGPGGEMGSQQQQRRALVAKIEGLAAAAAKARRGFAARLSQRWPRRLNGTVQVEMVDQRRQPLRHPLRLSPLPRPKGVKQARGIATPALLLDECAGRDRFRTLLRRFVRLVARRPLPVAAGIWIGLAALEGRRKRQAGGWGRKHGRLLVGLA